MDHYVSCLRLKHALPKRTAISIAVNIFQRLEIPIRDDIENNYVTLDAKMTHLSDTYFDELFSKWGKEPDINKRIKMHYDLGKQLQIDESRRFTIAPICKSSLPYIVMYKS